MPAARAQQLCEIFFQRLGMSESDLDMLGLVGPPIDAVRRLAALAVGAGAGAVVCSAHEVAAVRSEVGPDVVLITPGVVALGAAAVERIVKTIVAFDDFSHQNDPHEEHDFGSFVVDGETVFFKIDYYDLDRCGHSPDPADPNVTCRVMTLMLADEY